MTDNNQTIPFLPLFMLIKGDVDDGKPSHVYADGWPEIGEPCDASPVGQCQYSWHDGYTRCIHCKQESGL